MVLQASSWVAFNSLNDSKAQVKSPWPYGKFINFGGKTLVVTKIFYWYRFKLSAPNLYMEASQNVGLFFSWHDVKPISRQPYSYINLSKHEICLHSHKFIDESLIIFNNHLNLYQRIIHGI